MQNCFNAIHGRCATASYLRGLVFKVQADFCSDLNQRPYI